MIMPTVAIAILWQYIYEPGNGLLTALIQLVKPDFEFAWLATPGWSLLWIFVTICWQYTGFHTVLFMAGLSGIPNDYFEAARIDGASRMQIIRHITLPSILPTYFVLLMLNIANFLSNGMEQYFVFQNAFNKDKIQVLDLYVYNLAFGGGGYSLSTAISILKSIISITLLSVANKVSKLIRGEGFI